MSSRDFVQFSLQISTMLAAALLLGHMMRRVRQPPVLGEMLGGILLGPTILGALAPDVYVWLFQSSANVTVAREASIKLGMLFFLFIAGMETDLSDLRRMGWQAATIGLMGTLVPIAAGVGLVYALPRSFWGPAVQQHFLSFALFIGMNLANSANPVLARILMDLGLMRSELGSTMMTATIVDDLVNWTLFAIILRDIAPTQGAPGDLGAAVGGVFVFFAVVLGLGRKLGPPAWRWASARAGGGHAGVIGVTTLVVLVTSSVAEMLGIHAFLGAFLVGTALSECGADQDAYKVVSGFALSFFAPIFFVSMGLYANFITQFDALLAAVVVAAALASKVGGVLLGARMAGMPMDRRTLAIAFGLNARGATGIILAGVGLSSGVIDQRIFVAVVVMCLLTSLLAGPAMNALLTSPVPERLRAPARI
ncbi:MAG: cation:proton antiporter [Elusimicrobia bacterium]|nr:cation:proton antiporter [Elusimicrobiota bacterium]